MNGPLTRTPVNVNLSFGESACGYGSEVEHFGEPYLWLLLWDEEKGCEEVVLVPSRMITSIDLVRDAEIPSQLREAAARRFEA